MFTQLVRIHSSNSKAVGQVYANAATGAKMFSTLELSQPNSELEITYTMDIVMINFNQHPVEFITTFGDPKPAITSLTYFGIYVPGSFFKVDLMTGTLYDLYISDSINGLGISVNGSPVSYQMSTLFISNCPSETCTQPATGCYNQFIDFFSEIYQGEGSNFSATLSGVPYSTTIDPTITNWCISPNSSNNYVYDVNDPSSIETYFISYLDPSSGTSSSSTNASCQNSSTATNTFSINYTKASNYKTKGYSISTFCDLMNNYLDNVIGYFYFITSISTPLPPPGQSGNPLNQLIVTTNLAIPSTYGVGDYVSIAFNSYSNGSLNGGYQIVSINTTSSSSTLTLSTYPTKPPTILPFIPPTSYTGTTGGIIQKTYSLTTPSNSYIYISGYNFSITNDTGITQSRPWLTSGSSNNVFNLASKINNYSQVNVNNPLVATYVNEQYSSYCQSNSCTTSGSGSTSASYPSSTFSYQTQTQTSSSNFSIQMNAIPNNYGSYSLYPSSNQNQNVPQSESSNPNYANGMNYNCSSGSGSFPTATSTSFSFNSNNLNQYLAQPNYVEAFNLMFNLPTNPTIASTPSPLTAYPNGIFLNGAMFGNGISNSYGLDANIAEIMDCYLGHPQATNLYHHHMFNYLDLYQKGFTISDVPTMVGMMGDGFPILAPLIKSRNSDGTYTLYQNADLDECHGLSFSTTPLKFTINCTTYTYSYAYICTLEFPYVATALKGIISSSFYDAVVDQFNNYNGVQGNC